ncbi:MAG: Holliday junction branch migration protein RuvA [Simkaniaceae bacterium]|nr:Holliday junction branch migration protein RuvA [Simkaniaceae bacterium]
MFEYVRGTLAKKTPEKAVIDVSGVGYGLTISLRTHALLPEVGTSVKLYIHSVIRETVHRYFGFFSEEERTLFETVIGVSGIGPKTALALIGHLHASDIGSALSRSDPSSFSRVPGIGKKSAERLLVELKDNSFFGADSAECELVRNAVRTLTRLGYLRSRAERVVKREVKRIRAECLPDPSLSDLITASIKAI